MTYGYTGKIIEVDLTNKKYQIRTIPEEEYRKYLGGSGLAGKLLYSESDHTKPALSKESPLIFMAGLLTGTRAPAAAKLSVVAKSPLTGIWGESTVGGYFGAELKKAGYDGIIVKGKSKFPVALYVNNEQVEFRDARNLWGKDVYDAAETLKQETDEKAETACIGPAGENLVEMASIIFGGNKSRAAGRCGLGALMGFKNLKAIAVKGSQKVAVYDDEKLRSLVKEFLPLLKKNGKILHDYGTLGTIQAVEMEGDLPIKNWTLGTWGEHTAKISGQMLAETCQTGHYACFGCPLRCGKEAEVRVGPFKGTVGHGPEYETGAGFGSNILNDNLDCICAANDLCNRYGLDTIETSNVIAMAIESYENGLLTKEDTNGIELKWGISMELIPIIQKIAFKEGNLGKLLSQGVKKASEQLGGLAKEFAIQTKGLSFAMHDPRAFTTMVANYATANRGACHLEALGYFSEDGAFPAECIGFYQKTEPHGYEGKAEYAVRLQDFMCLFNALGLCKFIMLGNITPEIMKNWVNAATGWDMTTEEIELLGEKIFNLKRMYNVSMGISRKDDILPQRLMMHDKGTGAAAGSIPHYSRIMHDYYKYRKWSNEGIPTTKKLEQLGLKELVPEKKAVLAG